ncbi:hypothetical protein ASD89_01630 [Caulobacter sp. Root656]|nr:hypothetical protein ASD89_01630 [Caulobacter sp. Root656]
MAIIGGALAMAVALAGAATPAAADGPLIPAEFRGEWNSKTEDCGTANNDSRLVISADKIEFYESTGTVRAAFMRGPFEALIVADMTGEGATWLDSYKFILAGDGHYISTPSLDGTRFVRYRCPVKSK